MSESTIEIKIRGLPRKYFFPADVYLLEQFILANETG